MVQLRRSRTMFPALRQLLNCPETLFLKNPGLAHFLLQTASASCPALDAQCPELRQTKLLTWRPIRPHLPNWPQVRSFAGTSGQEFLYIMPLIIIFLALVVPRVVILVLWLLTPWFNGVFNSAILPVLGFLFLPLTLLWYSAVQHWFGGQWGAIPIIGLV